MTIPRQYFFCGSFMFLFCLVFAMSLCASVYMCFVVTCLERADLLALVWCVYMWICHFPIGILGQVWYLIVSIPDLCTLTYLDWYLEEITDYPDETLWVTLPDKIILDTDVCSALELESYLYISCVVLLVELLDTWNLVTDKLWSVGIINSLSVV